MTDSNPFAEIERVFQTMSQGLGGDLAGLPVDVREEDDEFVLSADVPGVDPSEVAVRVGDGREVTVEVSTARRTDEDAGEYVLRERDRRAVTRTVTLPAAVEEDDAAASVDAGVLEVRLPKRRADDTGTEIPVE